MHHPERISLPSDGCYFDLYRSVPEFALDEDQFTALWTQHPSEFHEVTMHGKRVKTPRWQQSYGKNYAYTGSLNNAIPLNESHTKYLEWCQSHVDERINGLLINWYAGDRKHYIGKHRDATRGLREESPIVTISHGGNRVFRFRPYGGKGYIDHVVGNGDVIVIPARTNHLFTHEVPYSVKYREDRISVTLRAYV